MGAAALVAVCIPAFAHAEVVGRTVTDHGPILVLLGVIASAYLLSYLLLQSLSQRYGFITGVPYVVLGIITVPAAGWLTAETVAQFEPLIAMAVAAVALSAGLQVDAQKLAAQKSSTVKLALTVIGATMVMVIAIPLLGIQRWSPPMERAIWFPALLTLGALALVSDGRPVRALAAHLGLDDEESIERARHVAWLSTIAGIGVFGLAFSIYNPGEAWRGDGLDVAAWLLAHLFAGGLLGAIGGALIQVRPDDDRVLTILLGLVATAAALAYATTLSVVFVSFLAGVILINMSSESLRFQQMLDSANPPLYVLLLFFVGTLWAVGLPPWVYAAVGGYLVLRTAGRLAGVALYRPRLSGDRPEPGLWRGLLAPGALTAAMILDFGFQFSQFEAASAVITGFVLILIAEELLSFVLLRGWLIDIADVETSRPTASPWSDWKGDQ